MVSDDGRYKVRCTCMECSDHFWVVSDEPISPIPSYCQTCRIERRIAQLRAWVKEMGYYIDTSDPECWYICLLREDDTPEISFDPRKEDEVDITESLLAVLSIKKGPLVEVRKVCGGCVVHSCLDKVRNEEAGAHGYIPGPNCFFNTKPGSEYEARIVWVRKEK